MAAASFSRCAAVAVFCCCTAAQAADAPAVPALTEEPYFGIGWLDQTQSFGSARADALAQQLDRFFGVERSDLEAAYSSLRLTTEARWHESDYIKPRVRLRGRLHLPRVDERLSLIFSEDQGEGTSYYNQNPAFVEQQSTRVNLEVNLRERERYRFDFRVGLRSSGRLRTGVRLRYEDNLGRNFFHRLSETVYYIDGTGYGSFTQYQLDRSLTVNSLLRWSTEFRAQESLAANEWASSLSYLFRNSDSTGISYFVGASGNSRDDFVGKYQLGLRLRRNIARPWLFWEILPGYQWEKLTATAPREGGLFAALRLEMAIGRY